VLKKLSTLIAVAAVVACSSSSHMRGYSGPPPDLNKHLTAGTLLLWLPSGGAFEDAGQIARVSISSNENVRRLATQLRRAATAPVQVAVASDNSNLSRAVSLAAIGEVEGPLPMLDFTFIGSPGDADSVRAAVESKKGRFTFKPWP
jgi:hypothetical protein